MILCEYLVKNLDIVFISPETLCEFKSDREINLAEENSMQYNIHVQHVHY